MTGRNTDHRNINLARLNRDVVFGKSEGKIIWQPRISCWLKDKQFAGEKLPEPYEGMTLPEIYRELGVSARVYEYNDCFKKVNNSRVKRYSIKHSETETEYVIETPVGNISSVSIKTPSSWNNIKKKRWICDEGDMKVATWIEERCLWEWDESHYEKTKQIWRDLGAPTVFMPRVNIQHLYIDMMGVEETIYAIYDYPETVEKYFKVIDESHERLIKVINGSPIEIINFGDNLHAGTVSPDLFQKYILPSYQKRNELLHNAGKFTHSHWDGDTKSLLPFAKECGLDGIEAITPKPQGDVTLNEVKEALGGEVFLIDGIAAILFDSIYTEDQLIEQAKEVIELFAPKLILGISDEISSTGHIERIKAVTKVVDDYNADESKFTENNKKEIEK